MYNDFKVIANYYDDLYVKPELYSTEIDTIVEICNKYKQNNGNRLLDVACGTGGHIPYLLNNFRVSGLDLSEDMLKIARNKYPNISFYCDNMMNFSLDTKFDIIICLYGSIGFVKTLPNVKQTLKNFSKHLNPGGLVILTPWMTKESFSDNIFVDTVANEHIKIARMENIKLKEENLVEVTFHHLIGENGEVKYHTQNIEVGLFSKDNYISAIQDSGLEYISFYDGPSIIMGAFICRLPVIK